jgi:hypothetical protein
MNIKIIACSVILFGLVLLLGCSGCSCSDNNTGNKAQNKVTGIYNYNIIIAPDLSNRVDMAIHPKPIEDKSIIKSTLEQISDVLHAGHRETDQRDSYAVLFVNQGVIRMYDINQEHLNIDFGKFPAQNQRMDFIKGRNKYEKENLELAVSNFQAECDRFYLKAAHNTDGADLWSFFQSGIDNSHVKKAEKSFAFNGQTFQNRYKNVLVLLTDGYIESGLSSSDAQGLAKNKSYDLGQSRINAFRRAFKASGMNNMQAFFNKNSYGIVPATNKCLADLEVLVLEMYDRSLSESGNARVHPTDADIMKLFWTDWLSKSGVKRFELHRCFSNERKAQQTLRNFILGDS